MRSVIERWAGALAFKLRSEAGYSQVAGNVPAGSTLLGGFWKIPPVKMRLPGRNVSPQSNLRLPVCHSWKSTSGHQSN